MFLIHGVFKKIKCPYYWSLKKTNYESWTQSELLDLIVELDNVDTNLNMKFLKQIRLIFSISDLMAGVVY